MLDKFKDECGVFGIFGNPEAANLTYLGLYALQHRGQESAGIVTADGERMLASRAMGHVADAFDNAALEGLPGHLAIGHTDTRRQARAGCSMRSHSSSTASTGRLRWRTTAISSTRRN